MYIRTQPAVRTVTAAGLGAIMALSGCATTSTAKKEDSVVIAIGSDYNNLDPARSNSSSGYTLTLALFERLVRMNRDGSFAPGLAESWNVTASSASFVLRDGITCSDGSKVTASTVKSAIEHLASPETASPNRARTFGSGDVTVTADDASRKVTVSLSEPFKDMLVGLSSAWGGIACGAQLDRFDGADGSAPPGTGAWVLDKQKSIRGSSYVLNRRSDYVAPPGAVAATQLPEKLVYRVIGDRSTVVTELITGGVDIGEAGLANVRALQGKRDLVETRTPTYGANFIYFRQRGNPLLGKEAMRKAIAHSLDREEGARVATAGLGRAAPSYLSSAVACTDGVADAIPSFDMKAAAGLMASLGYARDGDGFWTKNGDRVHLKIIAEPTSYPAGNEYVQDRLKTAGFDVRLEERPTPEVLEEMATGDSWDIALFPYGPPINVPNSATAFLASDSERNWSGIKNPEFDKGASRGISLDPQDPSQCDAWRSAQRALLTAADVVPLWESDTYWYSRTKVDVANLRSPSGYFIDPNSIRTPKK